MKIIISTIATVAILVSSFNSFAINRTEPLKDKDAIRTISHYLDATALGNVEINQKLFTKDFAYYNTANKTKHSKKDYSKFVKANKGLHYNCKTTYEILDQSDDVCQAKMTMEFEKFTRVDYINLRYTNGSWLVSEVITSYR